jgi:hypothetical protein
MPAFFYGTHIMAAFALPQVQVDAITNLTNYSNGPEPLEIDFAMACHLGHYLWSKACKRYHLPSSQALAARALSRSQHLPNKTVRSDGA